MLDFLDHTLLFSLVLTRACLTNQAAWMPLPP